MVFDDVCYHCVDTELADNAILTRLKEQYGVLCDQYVKPALMLERV